MYKGIVLDYGYNDLEPYIDSEVLRVHYQMYLSNLDKLNQLLDSVSYDYRYSLRELIDNIDIFDLNIRGEILYYLSSVMNHNLYFYGMSSRKNNKPIGKLKEDINKYFGSYEKFKREFIEKAMELKGSGYTTLVIDDKGRLKIMNTSNEDSPYYYGFIPIMGLDVWEHAYFLQYKSNRRGYINSFFEVIDYEKIDKCYRKLLEEK